MQKTERLVEFFREFPGIGRRQARRFVYFLLSQKKDLLEEFADLIKEIKDDIKVCQECQRFFGGETGKNVCSICLDENRDRSVLLIAEKDIDLENIEKSGLYRGGYFVLGGSIPILEKEPEKKVHLNELLKKIKNSSDQKKFREIILAFSLNPEGENTREIIEREILKISPNIKVSTLGRGLSTGSEIEYLDSETIKSAISNRK